MPEDNSERQGRILDAAARLIERYGYDKTSVEEIAREAGVSKGAIYLHFKSKDALFEALLLRESDAMVERFWQLLDADPRGMTLYTIYLYGLIVIDAAPVLKAVFTHDRRVLGDYYRHVRGSTAYADAMSLSVEFVRHFQNAGLIRRDLDPETVTYLLGALRYGILTMEDFSVPGQSLPSVAQLGETLAEMLATGLEPRAGESDPEAARKALQQLLDVRLRFLAERQGRNP